MIDYNITFHIDSSIGEEGLSYLRDVLIPSIASEGKFSDFRLQKVIAAGGHFEHNYAIRFRVVLMSILEEWIEKEEPLILRKLFERYGDRILFFSTILEEINI